jgi:aromatase
MNIAQSIFIAADIETTYAAFADIVRWKQILPDVLDVQLLYDDGYNQEFTMTVERPQGVETVRGVRYCTYPFRLELFQPEPPPGVARMAGVWEFTNTDDGTVVEASRQFALRDNPDLGRLESRDLAFAEKLRGYLATNLEHFKRSIETDAVH